MVKYIDILYPTYLDENMQRTIGGVQTYISDLIHVFESNGMSVRVVQLAEKDFVHKINEQSCVVGFSVNEKNDQKRYQALYDHSIRTTEKVEELLTLFATDIMIPRRINSRSIAIQHGIFWDVPNSKKRPGYRRILSKTCHAEALINRINKVDCLVCVDYNFLNWYRTQVECVTNTICAIPNYTVLGPIHVKENDVIKIIFARRFFEYRGTRVFTNVAQKILDRYSNVHITVAGSGPDEAWMKDMLKSYDNVSFIQYKSEESLTIHADKHIAVVPSLGSEGTSLSLLEAMASQCAVVCTNVGGMTNIVLNGYNGIMVSPGDEDALLEELVALIESPEKTKRLAKNGYETVAQGFSREVWAQNWLKVVRNFTK